MRIGYCCPQHQFSDTAAARKLHRRDPTGTIPIVRRWNAEFQRRITMLKNAARTALVEKNIIGLGSDKDVLAVGRAPHEKLEDFYTWLRHAVDTMLVSYDYRWLDFHLAAAYSKGVSDASRYMGRAISPLQFDERVAAMTSLAAIELKAIADAVVGGSVTQVARLIVSGGKARDAFMAVADRIQKIAVNRSRTLVNVSVVGAHATGSLDVYRLAGVKQIGIKPEHVPVHGIGDRVTVRAPWLEPFRRAARRRRGLGTTVAILSAGDDDVCPDCQDLEADSPYTLDEAASLIPFHPNCRCALVPWSDEVSEIIQEHAEEWFESVDWVCDAFNPNQERDYHGRWSAGGGGGPQSGSAAAQVISAAAVSAKINTNMSVKGDAVQPFNSPEAIYRAARADEPGFLAMVTDLAKSVGGEASFTPPQFAEPGTTLKTMESARRKTMTENGGDWSKLTDVVRGTVVTNSIKDARVAAATFIEQQGKNIVVVKDKFATESGYRDINIKFKLPSGVVAELQFNGRSMIEAKQGMGHKLYEQQRTLDRTTHNSLFMELEAQAQSLYEAAYRKDGNGNWGKNK